MKGEELSPEDHIVRYVKPSSMNEERVDGSEFQRNDKREVSVNWLEYYVDYTKEEQLAKIRRVIPVTLRRNGRFAELNVGKVRQDLAEKLPTLRIIHDPEDENPSHSEIRGLPAPGSNQAEMIGDMIAKCICDLHPAIVE